METFFKILATLVIVSTAVVSGTFGGCTLSLVAGTAGIGALDNFLVGCGVGAVAGLVLGGLLASTLWRSGPR